MTPTPHRWPRLEWLLYMGLCVLPVAGCEASASSSTSGPAPRPPAATDDREREDVWAIRCLTLKGNNRFELAKNYTDALKRVEGLKPKLVQTFHEDDESAIYYGRYQRRYDAKDDTESFRPDPLRDLDLIRHLSMTINDPVVGQRPVWPFQMATMSTLPSGRGAHPEWLLPAAKGRYSLQVAVFYNTEKMRQRKYAAEEYCRLLREEGHEAYYHHGEVNSSVCIGAFPEEAIQTFQDQDPYTGIIRVHAKIVDQRMLALQKKFPHNLHNGRTFYEITHDPKTGRKNRSPHLSFAVEIPRPGQDDDPFDT